MKEIPLTQGMVTLVDDEDYEDLSAFKWCAMRNYHTFYAVRHVRRLDGRRAMEWMHRVVLARKRGRALLESEKTDH